MDFKEFEKYVDSFIEISKDRYLITFNCGKVEIYNLKGKELIKESKVELDKLQGRKR